MISCTVSKEVLYVYRYYHMVLKVHTMYGILCTYWFLLLHVIIVVRVCIILTTIMINEIC